MNYAIRHVFDPQTGEQFDAEIHLKSIRIGQAFRQQYHEHSQDLLCLECHQSATVVGLKSGWCHFRHFPGTGACPLKERWSVEDRIQIEHHIGSRESERHKRLKNLVGRYLETQPEVEATSVNVDNHFIKDGAEKRRPDVFCKISDKSLAFEIQLSPLPPKYIFQRHAFYKRNAIYLAWLRVDFDPERQDQTDRDIKYLTEHQNHFTFLEGTAKPFHAWYKGVVKYPSGQTYLKWTSTDISINDLKFDNHKYQIYYKSLSDEAKQLSELRLQRDIEPVIDLLRKLYRVDDDDLASLIKEKLDSIDYPEIVSVNNRIAPPEADLFFRAIKEGRRHFLRFILRYDRFSFDLTIKDTQGANLLECVYNHDFDHLDQLMFLLFSSGYSLSNTDLYFLKGRNVAGESNVDRQGRILKTLAYSILRDRQLMELYNRYQTVMFTLLCAKYRRIIGVRFPNFVSIGNNAVQHYQHCWSIVEGGFKYYKFWDVLLAEDTKGTFKKKLDNPPPVADKNFPDIVPLVRKLFPEILGAGEPVPWIETKQDLLQLQPLTTYGPN